MPRKLTNFGIGPLVFLQQKRERLDQLGAGIGKRHPAARVEGILGAGHSPCAVIALGGAERRRPPDLAVDESPPASWNNRPVRSRGLLLAGAAVLAGLGAVLVLALTGDGEAKRDSAGTPRSRS